MNTALAREIFNLITEAAYSTRVTLDLVEACAMRWPSYPWLDWASDWEHEQLAKRYAA